MGKNEKLNDDFQKMDDWRIEEGDDPRTWDDTLVPDCEKGFEPETAEAETTDTLPVLEYLGEFKFLIDACGQVSYFFNMKKFLAAGVNKAKLVASAYQHDLDYYEDQLKEWRVKAERSYTVLTLYAECLGYEMPEGDERRKRILNVLAISKDRRKAYKGYLDTCLRNRRTLSLNELEGKYQLRLRKRLERAGA